MKRKQLLLLHLCKIFRSSDSSFKHFPQYFNFRSTGTAVCTFKTRSLMYKRIKRRPQTGPVELRSYIYFCWEKAALSLTRWYYHSENPESGEKTLLKLPYKSTSSINSQLQFLEKSNSNNNLQLSILTAKVSIDFRETRN